MVALRSLRPALSSLARNPLLFLVTVAFALIQPLQLAVQAISPFISAILSLVMTGVLLVVLPFYQGGLLALADSSRDGPTAWDAGWRTFLEAGKANYLPLLLAYLVVLAIVTAFGILLVGALFVTGAGLLAGLDTNAVVLPAVGLAVALVGIAYLLTMFFIQFYGHAIVLDDADVMESFKRSISLVRSNLLSVAGYTAIALVGGGVLGAVAGGVSLLFAPEMPFADVLPAITPVVLLVAGVTYVAATALLGAFYATYSVCVYRALTQLSPGASLSSDPSAW